MRLLESEILYNIFFEFVQFLGKMGHFKFGKIKRRKIQKNIHREYLNRDWTIKDYF
jgi:hypothetical protein